VSALDLDVAILGGGLAGTLLARQLRRTVPELHVGLFERSTETSWKVGESVVEIGSHYLIRRLGLTGYLYEHHVPKNGLRYFFDDPECDTPLHEMSEVGTVNLPFHPAFQVDRARMERDLFERNRADGVDARRGVRVEALELGRDGAPHRFELRGPGGTQPCRARWVVDATGRASLLAKREGLRVREQEHRIGSVWGRFEGVADIDDLGPESFRQRVRWTSRRLSTLHFWYPGYWIWVIPLGRGTTSVGVTGEPVAADPTLRTAEGFRAFLERHRGVATLLAPAKLADLGSYGQIAYGTRRFFSPDRWGLTGEAATASDPIYSPGTDFIALENDFLTDLIRRDAAGEDAVALAERTALYDRFMAFRHEATMLLYRGLYGCHGSFELMRLKWDFDLGCYYNLWVGAYMQNQYLDTAYLKRQLRQQRFVLQALRNFADLFRKLEATLYQRGEYHRANTGRFSYGLENIDFVERVGLPRSQREVLEQTAATFNLVRDRALDLLGDREGEARGPLPLTAFARPLA